jgi:hypothetical protein
VIERGSALSNVMDLIEELLDAHVDTVVMAVDGRSDPDWLGHVDYLRALHREGESVLARLAGE